MQTDNSKNRVNYVPTNISYNRLGNVEYIGMAQQQKQVDEGPAYIHLYGRDKQAILKVKNRNRVKRNSVHAQKTRVQYPAPSPKQTENRMTVPVYDDNDPNLIQKISIQQMDEADKVQMIDLR